MENVVLGQLGPWGLASACFMLVFLGGLIPRWTHNQRIKDKKEENDYLKATLAKRDEQFDKLINQNEVIVHMLEEIKKASKESRPVS